MLPAPSPVTHTLTAGCIPGSVGHPTPLPASLCLPSDPTGTGTPCGRQRGGAPPSSQTSAPALPPPRCFLCMCLKTPCPDSSPQILNPTGLPRLLSLQHWSTPHEHPGPWGPHVTFAQPHAPHLHSSPPSSVLTFVTSTSALPDTPQPQTAAFTSASPCTHTAHLPSCISPHPGVARKLPPASLPQRLPHPRSQPLCPAPHILGGGG